MTDYSQSNCDDQYSEYNGVDRSLAVWIHYHKNHYGRKRELSFEEIEWVVRIIYDNVPLTMIDKEASSIENLPQLWGIIFHPSVIGDFSLTRITLKNEKMKSSSVEHRWEIYPFDNKNCHTFNLVSKSILAMKNVRYKFEFECQCTIKMRKPSKCCFW